MRHGTAGRWLGADELQHGSQRWLHSVTAGRLPADRLTRLSCPFADLGTEEFGATNEQMGLGPEGLFLSLTDKCLFGGVSSCRFWREASVS